MSNSLRYDIWHGLRLMRSNKGFTAVVVLTLALAIGASTAMFSLIDALLLQPLPFANSDQLVMVWQVHPEIGTVEAQLTEFYDWKSQNAVFSDMAVYSKKGVRSVAVVAPQHGPEEVPAALVSANFFPLLGVNPSFGRGFLPEEVRVGNDNVALVSSALASRLFGRAGEAVDRLITVSGRGVRIVGVIAANRALPAKTDVWMPQSWLSAKDQTDRRYHSVAVIARLRPGSTVRDASRNMTEIERRLQLAYPAADKDLSVTVVPLRDELLGNLRTPLLILFSAVGLVLLIACANVANLLLARASSRRQEIGVRIALGANRSRVVRQLLAENVLVACLSGATGLVLAFVALPLFQAALAVVSTASAQNLVHVSVDTRVLLFTIAISLVTGMLFGILPALRLSNTNIANQLNQGTRTSSGGYGTIRWFVGGECALAVVVLVAAGLLTRSLQQLMKVDPGIRTRELVTASLTLPQSSYTDDAKIREFYQNLLLKLENLPGVEGVATVDVAPLTPSHAVTPYLVEGVPKPPGQFPIAQLRGVSPDYFKVLGIPIITGRTFEQRDFKDGADSAYVISESLARNYFPGQDPVGHRITIEAEDPNSKPVPIIGVVGDVHHDGIDVPIKPAIYYAGFKRNETVVLRSSLDAGGLSPEIRNAVLSLDPVQPIREVNSVKDTLAVSLSSRRYSADLINCFSALALVLAMIGIYGMSAYWVTLKNRDIGIRMALGANGAHVAKLVVRQALVPMLIGVVVGFCLAIPSSRLFSSLLYGVKSSDPITLAMTVMFLSAVVLIALAIPAWRAIGVDPVTTLRTQ